LRTAISSLYILKHAPDTFTGLQYAINLGGDVDSIAAICTGILAGRYGLDSLPKFMREETEGVEKLKAIGAQFAQYQKNTQVK